MPKGRRGRERMAVEFTIPMQSVPITTDVVSSNIEITEILFNVVLNTIKQTNNHHLHLYPFFLITIVFR